MEIKNNLLRQSEKNYKLWTKGPHIRTVYRSEKNKSVETFKMMNTELYYIHKCFLYKKIYITITIEVSQVTIS